MFRFSRPLARLLCVLLLALGSSWAQQPDTGSIVGEIQLARGTFPNDRVEVRLSSRGALVGTTYCDNEGKFAFFELPANNYHVSINDPKYEPFDAVVNVNPVLTRQTIVNITITPKPSDQPQPAPDAQVSGENPYMIDAAQYKNQVPKKALKEFEAGVKAQNAGKLDSAIRHWQAALALAPTFYAAHNNLGAAYLEQQNFPSAQAEFSKAMAMNPSDTQAYFNLGNVMLLTGRYDDAERVLEDGLRRRPNAAFGYFLLGTVAERRNRPADAEVDLRKALELDPLLAKVHLELVNLYLGQHHNEAAIAELQLFLQRFPNDPLAPKARDVLGKLQAATPR